MSFNEELEHCFAYDDLAYLLTDRMKKWYPNGDYQGWLRWSDKYRDFETAKRAASYMYERLSHGIEQPEPNVTVPTHDADVPSLRRFILR